MRKWVGLIACALVLAACSSTSSAGPGESEVPVTVSEGPEEGATPIRWDGLNVPWAVGGLRIERDGTKTDFQGDWPPGSFRALRLWDTRTAWLDLEPAPGQWFPEHLDALVAKAEANGVRDVLLVLAGTPQWAASQVKTTDAPWMGPGSASMPKDLEYWRRYVTTVAKHYAGRITAYEIGNEPNLLTYWNGTPQQWRDFVTTAADAIRAVDPEATIVVSGGLVRGTRDLPALSKWLSPLADLAAQHKVDGVAVHVYPTAAQLSKAGSLLNSVASEINKAGWKRFPKWITEINVTDGASLSAAAQQKAIKDLTAEAQKATFRRLYWYAWTDLGPPDLIQFQPGTPGTAALGELKSSSG